jgi:hypothetical protein
MIVATSATTAMMARMIAAAIRPVERPLAEVALVT